MTWLDQTFRHLAQARGAESRWIATARGSVHGLRFAGRGPLGRAVLVHGLAGSALTFTTLARRLVAHFGEVIVPELPGHGLTPAPAGLDADDFQAATRALLDALGGPAPVTLVGNSMGGLACARWAAACPDRVRSLTLLAPGGAPMSDRELRALLAAFEIDDLAGARRLVDRLFARPSPVLGPLLAREVLARARAPALRALIRSASPEHLLAPAELGALRAPTLLIWGARERLLPAAQLGFWVDHLPEHAQIERWPGYGHVDHTRKAAAIAARIAALTART